MASFTKNKSPAAIFFCPELPGSISPAIDRVTSPSSPGRGNTGLHSQLCTMVQLSCTDLRHSSVSDQSVGADRHSGPRCGNPSHGPLTTTFSQAPSLIHCRDCNTEKKGRNYCRSWLLSVVRMDHFPMRELGNGGPSELWNRAMLFSFRSIQSISQRERNTELRAKWTLK